MILVGEQHEQCACSGVPKGALLKLPIINHAKSLITRGQKKRYGLAQKNKNAMGMVRSGGLHNSHFSFEYNTFWLLTYPKNVIIIFMSLSCSILFTFSFHNR